ncbi:MAG TPA: IS630 family transposase [Candidatus Binatia bacterium]|nr:IS630 family transposase [Candidatus Binatia bacterium]
MARTARPLIVSAEQQAELRRLLNRSTATQREVRRARIILERAAGSTQEETASRVGVNRPVVALWERRFRMNGLAGLTDARGRGRKPSISAEKRERVIVGATRPPAKRSRWSVRTMARETGVSPATVQRLWSSNDIKPHLTRTFKLSNDPDFEAKFWDVIGLYLHPPAKALVLCCDEKSQCQALERTQPGLPLKTGHIRTRTHDYIRHGTITLFAALNYLDGKIASYIAPEHTNVQWLAFLKQLDQEMPSDVTLHLIVDNYGTHKHPKVRSWLKWRNARNRTTHGVDRIIPHFTPTSSSWMNLVERFFRDLTQDAIREESFTGVGELTTAITDYLAERNLVPKRYVWRAEGAEILEKIEKARKALQRSSV